MLIVTIGIIEMVTNTDEFMSSKKKIALLSICILLAMFFRNNGIYAFILAFPFFLIAMKKYWKKILIIFLLPIILIIVLMSITKIDGIIGFIAYGSIYTIMYCIISYFLCMNEYEKELVNKAINIISKRLKKV